MNVESHVPYGPCEDYGFDIAELIDGALSPEHARIVRLHLNDCLRCRRWHAEIAGVDAALAAHLPRPVLSPGFDAALHARIETLTGPEALRVHARAAAEKEYQGMVAALARGWRWRTVLNSVATASAMGGALVALQKVMPDVVASLGFASPAQLSLVGSLTLGLCAALGAAAWVRSRGAASPMLFG